MSNENAKSQDLVASALSTAKRATDAAKAGGVYRMECVGADGQVKWVAECPNLVVNVGLQDMNAKYFSGSAYTATWFIGLYGAGASNTPAAGDTAASHAGWTEVVPYSNATRPTAINLRWALERVRRRVEPLPMDERATAAEAEAGAIAEEDVAMCEAIGAHGLEIFQRLAAARPAERRGEPFQVLTHCNAGWLATVDWGTALAPIYKAHRAGLPLHVWVDETRPRNQGASLTAYELGREGVPHTVIVDNAGGHLMQHGQVDAVIVGSDRTTRSGDVCNKIGTYLKALAAHDNGVPFYVALPASTIDWSIGDGVAEIPIEARAAAEVTHIQGRGGDGAITTVQLTPDGSAGFNPAFDVTPARLVTALITERGATPATEEGLRRLYSGEHSAN